MKVGAQKGHVEREALPAEAATICRTLVAAVLLVAGAAGHAQTAPVPTAQQRHFVNAHVPPPDQFHAILKRDLLAQFGAASRSPITDLSYELLRNEPTQSGTSHPRYYAWVTLKSAQGVATGAAKFRAEERKRFVLTNFLNVAQIRADPQGVGKLFPADLVPKIVKKANAK